MVDTEGESLFIQFFLHSNVSAISSFKILFLGFDFSNSAFNIILFSAKSSATSTSIWHVETVVMLVLWLCLLFSFFCLPFCLRMFLKQHLSCCFQLPYVYNVQNTCQHTWHYTWSCLMSLCHKDWFVNLVSLI